MRISLLAFLFSWTNLICSTKISIHPPCGQTECKVCWWLQQWLY
jgi:hypothetical protein